MLNKQDLPDNWKQSKSQHFMPDIWFNISAGITASSKYTHLWHTLDGSDND